MRTEKDILYETEHYWVSWDKFKDRRVAHVWKKQLTHSVLVATFDLRDQDASVKRAIREVDDREFNLIIERV